MGWRAVLHIRSSTASASPAGGGETEETGWCLQWPDTTCATVVVEVHPSGDLREVHMPWADRPPMFAEFLQRCSAVGRYAITLRGGTVQRYSLWVEEDAIRTQMATRGTVDGELVLLAVLRGLAPVAQLPREAAVFQLPPSIVDCTPDHAHAHRQRLRQLLAQRGWTPLCPAYDWQLDTVRWLQGVEASARDEEVAYDACIPLGSSGWAYRVSQDQLRPSRHGAPASVRVRGAVCCDSVGAGKTVAALALIVASEPSPRSEKDGIRPRTDATLVIVTTNVAQQWLDEIARFAGRTKAIALLGARDVKAYTMHDLVEADVVVTTLSALRGKPYTDTLEEYTRLATDRAQPGGGRARDAATLCITARVASAGGRDLHDVPPLVECVRWRRVVVDEVHEVVVSARDRRLVSAIAADSVVGLTGTPDTSSSDALANFYPLLLRPARTDEEVHPHPCLSAAIEYGLLRRHAGLPETPQHRVVHAPLSATERLVLSALGEPGINTAEAVLLCCGMWASDTHDAMTPVELVASVLAWYEARAAAADDDVERARTEAQRRYVAGTIEAIQEGGVVCSVCMERPCDSLLLACGHAFCARCSNAVSTCPMCRAPVVFRHGVSDASERSGSRARAAVELIRGLVGGGDRVIVFAQWRAVLHGVAIGLGRETPHLLLEGPTARRAQSLRRFQEGDVSVLMLCTERCASGVHLACARHVVLLHPFVGSPHETAALEAQAVGRALRQGQTAQVIVHHLFAPDTEEEVLWRSRHTV